MADNNNDKSVTWLCLDILVAGHRMAVDNVYESVTMNGLSNRTSKFLSFKQVPFPTPISRCFG